MFNLLGENRMYHFNEGEFSYLKVDAVLSYPTGTRLTIRLATPLCP